MSRIRYTSPINLITFISVASDGICEKQDISAIVTAFDRGVAIANSLSKINVVVSTSPLIPYRLV
jgi:predicted transcriptional regulator